MRKAIPTIVILILIGVLGTVFFRTYVVKYSYSAEKADLNAYYGVEDESDYPVVLADALSDYHAKKIDDSFYLRYEDVRELLNDRFYYSEADRKLMYCLPDTRVTAAEGQDVWTDSSGKENKEAYKICAEQDGTVYVALDFVLKYSNFSYETFTEPNRMRIYTEWGERQEADVTKTTNLRAKLRRELLRQTPSE